MAEPMLTIIPLRSIKEGKLSRVEHQGGREIDRDLTSQLLGSGIGEQSGQAQAGVVDQDIEPTESFDRLGDQASGSRRVGQVGGDREDLETLLKGPQLTGQPLEAIATAGRQYQRPCLSTSHQLSGQGRADAGRGACDQHDPARSRSQAVVRHALKLLRTVRRASRPGRSRNPRWSRRAGRTWSRFPQRVIRLLGISS